MSSRARWRHVETFATRRDNRRGGPLSDYPGPRANGRQNRARRTYRLSERVDVRLPMSVKTITVTKEAYDALASLKHEGESFSEVIRRLTGTRAILSAFAGAWSGVPKGEVTKLRRFLRDSDRLSQAKLRRATAPRAWHRYSR